VYVAEGVHLAREALRGNDPVEAFVVSPRMSTTPEGLELLAAIRELGTPCFHTADATLDGIQDARSPQPVVCVVHRRLVPDEEIERRFDGGSFAVVLDGIQDPGNLGAVVRSADGAGCDLVLVTGRSADPYHPRAVRATMGSIFRLPVVEQSTDSVTERLRSHGYRLAGADPHGGVVYREAELGGRVALVLGSEGSGISPGLREQLDITVTIPLNAGVESLSVGAAAAVLLFEIARQRRP